MEMIKWVFDGIGSQIIGIIAGLLLGSTGGIFLGYRIGIRNRIQQKQKGGNDAKQTQIGSINNVIRDESKKR